MSPKLRTLVTTLALLPALAAAHPAAAHAASGPSSREVTQKELRESRQSNLLDFVRSARPQWLRTRGVQQSPVMVYLDGQRVGGPEQLRLISTEITSSLRFVDAQEATTRWGPGHQSGAILISTGPLDESLKDEWRPDLLSLAAYA
jgi:hypothetical protein